MLILTRRINQRVRIKLPDGRFVWVQLAEIQRGLVRIGFEGPRDIEIDREELLTSASGERKERC